MNRITRRDFIYVTLIAAGASLLTFGCTGANAKTAIDMASRAVNELV